MQNPMKEMMSKRKAGIHCGVPAYCTANKLVIEAILEQAKRFDDTILIEATSNQVNQYGGYTGMQPKDFKNLVYEIADRIDFPRERIILGGDHLGPLVWVDLPEKEAMEKAVELVKLYVKAGFAKIHLDTSMRVGDDSVDEPLLDEVIAARGAMLYKACEEAYQELLEEDPSAIHPVFVIGSEVPIPGGAQEEEDTVAVTKPEAFESTIVTYKKKFAELGLEDAFEYIIAVVVQPGVEFGNAEIHHYNQLDSHELCETLKKYPDIVFEGHSTDYQSPDELRRMVEDGIAILKVGPALTFAFREALFALSMMEKELVANKDDWANFCEVLEEAMMADTKNWKKYYPGTEAQQFIERRYSFSDRCRYYMTQPQVEDAISKLFENMDAVEIPMGMLRQYMPLQYIKVRDGKLSCKAKDLVKDNVVTMVEDYNYAVKHNYMISGVFVK